MSGSESRDKDSVTEVAGESFVRERPPEIERGTVLASRYQIEDVIGKGGSGIVLRVFDRVAQNVVALKVLKAELARDAKWEKRFSRELRLGRPIQHPNVCRIFDIGEADGYRFLTMELASGGSLRDELKRTRSLDRPLEERLADAKAVIDGLAALHAAGVVHRDFKPDNILRMGDGRLVLSDFGLATDAANAAGATVLIGTPHYMAPEVLAGEPASTRSDVWALGVVLHEIFFGQRPERRSVSFDGTGKGPLRPATSIERAMLALCERCLLDLPLERPSDATEVAKMFLAARPSRTGWSLRSRQKLLAYGLGVLATVAISSRIASRHRQPAPPSGSNHIGVQVLAAPIGTPVEWTNSAKVITEVQGKVHCFSIIDAGTALLVWGAPRRAEEVDLTTGRRRPSRLVPDTYGIGCPDLSPSGSSLIFTALTSVGAKEIRLSGSRDGSNATAITSGSEPLWLGGSEEFVYTIDVSHAAIFALPTMTFSLLREADPVGHPPISDKAVSKDGRAIALLLYGNDSNFRVAVYSGKDFGDLQVFQSPGLRRAQFGSRNDEMLAAYGLSTRLSTLARIDRVLGTARNVGRYADFDILGVRNAGTREMLLVRRVLSDAWTFDGPIRERLTSNGRTYGVARSRRGDLLLAKSDELGMLNIWWQGHDGTSRRLTHGRSDVAPDFSPSGRSWVYADYERKSIMSCSIDGDSCEVLREDDSLPTWPRFSPDGENLAYLTQTGSTQLTVISAKDGHYKMSWAAAYDCPPVWSSPAALWTISISSGRYTWVEREVATGRETGRRVRAPVADAMDEVQCWPKIPAPESPLSHSVGVVSDESSAVLQLP